MDLTGITDYKNEKASVKPLLLSASSLVLSFTGTGMIFSVWSLISRRKERGRRRLLTVLMAALGIALSVTAIFLYAQIYDRMITPYREAYNEAVDAMNMSYALNEAINYSLEGKEGVYYYNLDGQTDHEPSVSVTGTLTETIPKYGYGRGTSADGKTPEIEYDRYSCDEHKTGIVYTKDTNVECKVIKLTIHDRCVTLSWEETAA